MKRRTVLQSIVTALFSGVVSYNKSIQGIQEAQNELKGSKEYPLAIIKDQRIQNNHNGPMRGNWKQMLFKFDNKNKITKMFIDGEYQAEWSRLLNNDETCSLSINYLQLFS